MASPVLSPPEPEKRDFASLKDAIESVFERNPADAGSARSYMLRHYKPEWDAAGLSPHQMMFIHRMIHAIDACRDTTEYRWSTDLYFAGLFEFLDARVANQGVALQRDSENANSIRNKLARCKESFTMAFRRSFKRGEQVPDGNHALAPRDTLVALEDLLGDAFGDVVIDPDVFVMVKKEIMDLIGGNFEGNFSVLRSKGYSYYEPCPARNRSVIALQLANKLLASAKVVEKPVDDLRKSNQQFLADLWKI